MKTILEILTNHLGWQRKESIDKAAKDIESWHNAEIEKRDEIIGALEKYVKQLEGIIGEWMISDVICTQLRQKILKLKGELK